MTPHLLFLHGWGFDATVWAPLRAALGAHDAILLDFGFFGTPVELTIPPDRPLVAVGHSLGALWLLRQRPAPWQALIALNGFPRFTQAPDFAPAVPRRILDRMIARLDQDPAGGTTEFRRRCGVAAPLPGPADGGRLRAGLMGLRDWDARPETPATPILALAGRQDPIVAPAMTAQAFAGLGSVDLHWSETAGHMLPLTDPDWCADRIRVFLAGLVP